MSATAFAAALGVPTNRITAILNGDRGVTADTALRISRYLGMPARDWMNLQQSFELRCAEINSGDAINRAVKPRTLRVGPDNLHPPGIASDRIGDPIPEISGSAIRTGALIQQEKSAELCESNGISRLAIFGSVLRDEFNSDSDVDFLVEFEPGRVPGFMGMARIELELSNLIGGRKADLRTPQELSRRFRDRVLNSAVTQYAKG